MQQGEQKQPEPRELQHGVHPYDWKMVEHAVEGGSVDGYEVYDMIDEAHLPIV